VFSNTHTSYECTFGVTLFYLGGICPQPGLLKTHIVANDVVGLLLGALLSMKKRHIVAKDVVVLQVKDSKNNREFD
jgi:hypothetical protein